MTGPFEPIRRRPGEVRDRVGAELRRTVDSWTGGRSRSGPLAVLLSVLLVTTVLAPVATAAPAPTPTPGLDGRTAGPSPASANDLHADVGALPFASAAAPAKGNESARGSNGRGPPDGNRERSGDGDRRGEAAGAGSNDGDTGSARGSRDGTGSDGDRGASDDAGSDAHRDDGASDRGRAGDRSGRDSSTGPPDRSDRPAGEGLSDDRAGSPRGGSDAAGDGPSGAGSAGGGDDTKALGRGSRPAHAIEDPRRARSGAGPGPGVSAASGRDEADDDPPRIAVSAVARGAGADGGAGPGSDPGTGADRPAPSVVRVEVSGTEAGDRVRADVTMAATGDDEAAFDAIALTVERGGDFAMTVTTSREPQPGSPAFEPGDGADSLAHVRLGHTIANADVDGVSFTFRVSKDRLRSTETDPEEVALYRYAGGSWTVLRTDVVGETAGHYVFAADSPGLSEFAIGAKRPEFDLFRAGSLKQAGRTTVYARVTNVGGADGVFEAELALDGGVVATRSITVAAGGTRQVSFAVPRDRAGTFSVTVNDMSAGEVSVATSNPPAADRPRRGSTLGWLVELGGVFSSIATRAVH